MAAGKKQDLELQVSRYEPHIKVLVHQWQAMRCRCSESAEVVVRY